MQSSGYFIIFNFVAQKKIEKDIERHTHVSKTIEIKTSACSKCTIAIKLQFVD